MKISGCLRMRKIWSLKCWLFNLLKDYHLNRFWYILSWQAPKYLNKCQLQSYTKLQAKHFSNKMVSSHTVPINLCRLKLKQRFSLIWIELNQRKGLVKGCYCAQLQVSIEICSITGKIIRKRLISSKVVRRWWVITISISHRVPKPIWDRIWQAITQSMSKNGWITPRSMG